eukprot:TRINITY_DN71910_c0_g1_i1.p1 TRINITY_DN71910_c0_g1~~TRINITY_DN71910_c0_g1_i1.p1  ORF type:complete len:595 (-),score=39.99 TRINITY_DN71910_c0_g1_i1:212-1963(-)
MLALFLGLWCQAIAAREKLPSATAVTPCHPPKNDALSTFVQQCGGHCQRAVCPSDVRGKGGSKTKLLAPYVCAPGLWTADQFWSEESLLDPLNRSLRVRDPSLLRAMDLSLMMTEFDTVSPERRARIDNAMNASERNQAMELGIRRPTWGHASRNAFKSYAAVSSRGYESAEDAVWWIDTSTIFSLGVFDGHGGPEAADAVAHKVLRELTARSLGWLRGRAEQDDTSAFIASELRDVLRSAQQQLRTSIPRMRGGTTASVVVGDKASKSTTVAWLGDSQVLHARRDPKTLQFMQLWFSNEHHCTEDVDWKQRLDQSAWCSVEEGAKPRVCRGDQTKGRFKSCIGMTRSLGDFDFLDVGDIMDTPEIYHLDFRAGDLLLVASDGLWDMMKVDHVLDHVSACRGRVTTFDGWLPKCLEDLLDIANYKWGVLAHSVDDISIVAYSDSGAISRATWARHLILSSPAFLGTGGMDDWCTGTCDETAFAAMSNWMRGGRSSSCGDTWILSTNGKTRQPLCCSRDSEDKYGKCKIPLGGFCDDETRHGCADNSMCIAGIFSAQRTCQDSTPLDEYPDREGFMMNQMRHWH